MLYWNVPLDVRKVQSSAAIGVDDVAASGDVENIVSSQGMNVFQTACRRNTTSAVGGEYPDSREAARTKSRVGRCTSHRKNVAAFQASVIEPPGRRGHRAC